MELFANNIKLPFGDSLVLKFFNPMFNDIGGYSFPVSFNAKLSSVQQAFGFPSTEAAEIIDNIQGEIRSEVINLTGKWSVIRANNSVIEAYFRSSSGSFFSEIQSKFITDIDFGGVRLSGGNGSWQAMLDVINTTLSSSYPDKEYTAYCAYMPNAAGDGLNKYFVNPVSGQDGVAAIQIPSNGSNSVFLFVGTVIDFLFNSHGYKIESNIFRTDSELKRMTILNTYNIFAPHTSDYYNVGRIDFSKLLPKILCSDFLKAVTARFNIGFFINEQSKSVVIKKFDDVIYPTGGEQATRSRAPEIENTRLKGIDFPLNAPDAFSSHNYKGTTGLTGAITVDKFRDILPETRTEGDILFVTSEQTYYRILLDMSVKSADRLCPKQYPYGEGDESTDMSQLSGIPSMYTHSTIHSYYYPPEDPLLCEAEVDYLLVRCDLAGNREGYPYTDFPLIFVSARGIQDCWVEAVEGAPALCYPMGSTDLFDASGNALANSELALKWQDASGIIARYWINRLAWEQRIKKQVKREFRKEDIIKLIDFTHALRVSDDNYLVNTFDLEMDTTRTVVKEAVLLRL
jgi:hypothetical protein